MNTCQNYSPPVSDVVAKLKRPSATPASFLAAALSWYQVAGDRFSTTSLSPETLGETRVHFCSPRALYVMENFVIGHPPSGQLNRFNCNVVELVNIKSFSFGSWGGPPLVFTERILLGLPFPTLKWNKKKSILRMSSCQCRNGFDRARFFYKLCQKLR